MSDGVDSVDVALPVQAEGVGVQQGFCSLSSISKTENFSAFPSPKAEVIVVIIIGVL